MNAFDDPVFQRFNAHSVKLMVEKIEKLAEAGDSEKVQETLKTLAYATSVPGSGYTPASFAELRQRTQEKLEKAKPDVSSNPS